MQVNEEFFHYIWLFRLFNASNLRTEAGETIRVLHPGIRNANAGPDFSDAHLYIGKTKWAGAVEIHIRASDWLLHGHQHDSAYNNVILHVVYDNDSPIFRPDGSTLPVLSLRNKIHSSTFTRYENLITAPFFFPCAAQIGQINSLIVVNQLTKVAIERLVDKSNLVIDVLNQYLGDWESTFYYFLAKNFGFKVNALPFEMLAKSLPYKILIKHSDQPQQVEALLFGQAGLLTGPLTETYAKQLKKEYQYLQKKYALQPIDRSVWKFMRMRPQNFPTMRIAQFATLLTNERNLFAKILEITDIEVLIALFDYGPRDNFWRNHYHFNKTTNVAPTIRSIGKSSIVNILTNTIAVFLFAYGRFTDQESLMSRAFDLLNALPPENNHRILPFVKAGLKNTNASDSQAIIQLFRQYCIPKKCLQCSIGIEILKQKNPVSEYTETG